MRRDMCIIQQPLKDDTKTLLNLSRDIFMQMTRARYLLEHDLLNFLKRFYSKLSCSYPIESLLKRMDMNKDGMVDSTDLFEFINGHDTAFNHTQEF